MKPTQTKAQAIKAVFKNKPAEALGNVRHIAPPKDVIFTRPDWQSAGNYYHLFDASLRAIAWEFLRRNPDYQSAWKEYAARVLKAVSGFSDVVRYAKLTLSSNATDADFKKLGDSAKLDDLDARYCEFTMHKVDDLGQLKFIPLDSHYGQSWGLKNIVNPATNYGGSLVRFLESAGIIRSSVLNMIGESDTIKSAQQGLKDTKWLSLLVDLSLPLSVIDAQLRLFVRSNRKLKVDKGIISPINKRDISSKKYAGYLRILDAYSTGLNASEIGKKLAPNRTNDGEARQRDKAYSAALAVALDLQKEGYRVLPLLEFKSRGVGRKK